MRKVTWTYTLYLITKMNSKWIVDLNCNNNARRFLENNMGKLIYNFKSLLDISKYDSK